MKNTRTTVQRLSAMAAGTALALGGFAMTAAPANAASPDVSPQASSTSLLSDVTLINGPLLEGPLIEGSLLNLILGPFNFGQFQ